MMKKNGFISISIIYSFFIIFMLTLVLIMTSYVNTRIRLNIYKKDIKKSYSVKETILYDKIIGLNTSTIYKDDTKNIGYRYIGTDPNNYISFNNEIWRIVGAICKNTSCSSKSDYVIKIVRDNIGFKSAWDCKKNGVGTSTSDTGLNNWKRSQLMLMLNSLSSVSGYTIDKYSVKDSNNIVIYPYMGAYLNDDLPLYKIVATGTSGFNSTTTITKCSSSSSRTTNCLRPINSLALSKLENFKHLINTFKLEDVSSSNTIAALEKNGSTSWSGKVGLLFASDICYAYKNATNRNNCLKNSALADNDSWLKISGEEWLLDATSDKYVLYKGSTFLKSNNLCAAKIIRPVVYLTSTTKIVGNNDGSSSQPFIIGEA